MKSLRVSLFALALFWEVCSAQNYRTVLPDTTVFFLSNSSSRTIKAIRIDTSYLSGADTVYYNFTNFGPLDNGCSNFQPDKNGWLGNKIIAKPGGENIFFFNFSSDSITIHTQAALGETWTVYELWNTDYLEGTVSAITSEQVLGVTDSVKTITLQAKDDLGTPVTYPINGKEIKIAKHLGIIQLPDFYHFPFDSFMQRVTDKKMSLTMLEVYNFNVGDKIQIYRPDVVYPHAYADTYTLNEYLSKRFSANNDTVFYTVKRTIHYYHNEGLDTIPPDESHSIDTVNFFVTDLDSIVALYGLPDEEVPLSSSMFGSSFSLLDICGERRHVYVFDYGVTGVDSCWASIIDPFGGGTDYIEGIGTLLSRTWDLSGYIESVSFYQSGSCTYGNLFTGINSPELDEKSVSIYPNPAADEVTVNIDSPMKHEPVSLSIHDVTGKKVFSLTEVQQFPLHISTNHFANGCYFVFLYSQGSELHRKVMVQR